jgi:hypothetical protein
MLMVVLNSPFTAEIYAEKAAKDAKKDVSKRETRSSAASKKKA